MRRRVLIALALLIGAVVCNQAGAQQVAQPLVGYLSGVSVSARSNTIEAFKTGLGSEGFVEGRNVRIEYLSADGRPDRLPGLAVELARRKPAVIAATGGPLAGLAAKRATATIPIVFTSGIADPVKVGLVAGLNRPGGNLTGVYFLIGELVAKRLALMKEVILNR